MNIAQHPIQSELSSLARLEQAIVESLNQSEDELAHAECFDQEQRSEMYAILEVLRNDSLVSKETLQKLAGHAELGT